MSGHVPGPWTRDYFRQIAGGNGQVVYLDDLRDRCVSDDWPPCGHGIEDEAKAGVDHE